MKKESKNKLWIVTIFAIAMGFLEATVVVYLREIYYKGGFDFPLKGFIDPQILAIEWVREFGTIVMLLAIGALAGKKFYEKLAYFIYAFAIWDIFYYAFLKATLNWPSSLITWDLLFLIPLPWIGPVITPVICSLILIVAAFLIIHYNDLGKKVRFSLKEWIFLVVGMILVLYTWLYDYSKLIFEGGFGKDFFTLATNEEFSRAVSSFIPQTYNWPIFWLGILSTCVGVYLFYRRTSNKKY